MDICERGLAGTGHCKCKALELGACFLCGRNIQGASIKEGKQEFNVDKLI